MVGAAIGLIATAISAGYGAWSANQQGKAQASEIKRQSHLQADNIRRQASAEAEAQRAQSRTFGPGSLKGCVSYFYYKVGHCAKVCKCSNFYLNLLNVVFASERLVTFLTMIFSLLSLCFISYFPLLPTLSSMVSKTLVL